jgi:FMN phosphatase YigB (HAD superfamily)
LIVKRTPPEKVIFVGDIHEIDIVGARGAGLRKILIDPLGRWTDLGCEHIAGVYELPAMLGGAEVPGSGNSEAGLTP